MRFISEIQIELLSNNCLIPAIVLQGLANNCLIYTSIVLQGLANNCLILAIVLQGLAKKFIFSHHGDCYSNNLISWYDQHMNQRELQESTLPKLRTWDGKFMAWVPEKTDRPLQGIFTVAISLL